MEDCYMAKATERLLLPLLRKEIPAVVDFSFPMEGIFHGCAIIAIRKKAAEDARQVMETVWQSGRLGTGRLLVVVDEDVAVADWSQVMWKVINNADWARDVTIHNGRMGIDATAKTGMQDGMRVPIRKDPAVVKLVNEKWRHYGW
jgi:4-hydroxy-3-polyprenylbenzoate decarboxylase